MRNFITLCSFFLLLIATSQAQTLSGKYAENSRHQTLIFTGTDQVQFNLVTNGCLIYNFTGKGTYNLEKGRIWITPILPKTTQYRLASASTERTDSLRFFITDSVQHPVIGASVLLRRAGKTIAGIAVGRNGVGSFPKKLTQPGDSVRIAFIGYYTIIYQANINADQYVTMLQGTNDAYYFDYLSNHGKGYPYKLTANSIRINFKDAAAKCGTPNYWVEFKKV